MQATYWEALRWVISGIKKSTLAGEARCPVPPWSSLTAAKRSGGDLLAERNAPSVINRNGLFTHSDTYTHTHRET